MAMARAGAQTQRKESASCAACSSYRYRMCRMCHRSCSGAARPYAHTTRRTRARAPTRRQPATPQHTARTSGAANANAKHSQLTGKAHNKQQRASTRASK
eukprot:scaffold7099_cov131-Isochrysis_galbana.AAC.4